jgi:flagellar assembly protein FliH
VADQRQQALGEIENIRAMALTNIAQAVASAMPTLRAAALLLLCAY